MPEISGGRVRNSSIDLFRYIAAVMVVAIHTQPFSDVSGEAGYVFSQILPRAGVPFFFAVSGYFYIQKLEKKQKPFLPYIRRLLVPYVIWSCVYYLVDFCAGGYQQPVQFLGECVYRFLITGSHVHFWFFPALIYSVCLATLAFKIKAGRWLIPVSVILYLVGCLGCSYYELGIRIPVLSGLFLTSEFTLIRRILLMGFSFFVSGYLVYKIRDKAFRATTNKGLFLIWCITVVIWLSEICFVRAMEYQENIIITFGLYPLVAAILLILLRNPLPEAAAFSGMARVIANFTFYSHPLCIRGLSFIGSHLLHVDISETPVFFMTLILTFAGGFIIYKWDNKLLNKIVI